MARFHRFLLLLIAVTLPAIGWGGSGTLGCTSSAGGGGMTILHHDNGEVTEIRIDAKQEACAVAQLQALIATAGQPVRLIVTDQIVEAATGEGEWMEFLFTQAREFRKGDGSGLTMGRLLVPIRHPTYARPDGGGNLIFFPAKDGWLTGPLASSEGQSLIPDLVACLQG